MKVYKILDNVYVLEDITKCCSNVIIGDEKALVFDTGTGIENLYDEIKKITDLDLIVINSHGHFDHIGGNYLFDSVYIHPLDYYLPSYFYNIIQTRKTMIEYYDLKNIKDNNFFYNGWGNIKILDFDSIDLGNLFCEIIHIPGHTAGSIGILIPKLKLFLSGDTLSPSICLNFPNALTIDDLINTLYSIQKLNFNAYFVEPQII